VGERTLIINRLGWHLHESEPGWEPKARSLDRRSAYDAVDEHLVSAQGVVARLARNLVARLRILTLEIDQVEEEIADVIGKLAPSLIAIVGRSRCASPKTSPSLELAGR
jgi:hypothetical protein